MALRSKPPCSVSQIRFGVDVLYIGCLEPRAIYCHDMNYKLSRAYATEIRVLLSHPLVYQSACMKLWFCQAWDNSWIKVA